MHRRIVAVVSLVFAVVTPAGAATCTSVHGGAAIMLKSPELDPDVLVWDTKTRVVAYSSGAWQDTSEVMSHTVLSKPGTRAVVVACDKDLVKSRYVNSVLDAVGIKITNGPDKGRYGWVTSEDVHPLRSTNARL
ncbi:MAG: hypothetical protein ABR591_14765 [Candidatus Velthaea sp.]